MRKIALILSLLLSLNLNPAPAQEKIAIEAEDYGNQQIEMADRFRADGKIWVVMLVAGLIFIGFIGYTVSVDRRLRKLEKLVTEHKPNQPA